MLCFLQLDLCKKYLFFWGASERVERTLKKLSTTNTEKFIIDIRNLGLMGAIHFGSEDNRSAVEVASKVFKYCYENDVLVRFSGEFIVLSPALIVEEEQIKLIIETIRQGIHSLN